jgi:hypothetical protein
MGSSALSRAKMIERFVEIVIGIVSTVPRSKQAVSDSPRDRAKEIVKRASLRAAAVSGGLALPVGPLGLFTLLPDLTMVWRIQAHMVADVAAVYGKEAHLAREQMIYCLFRHAASQLVRDLVVRTGQRMLIQQASVRVMKGVLRKIGARVLKHTAGKTLARLIPLIGAAGVGAYAYWDTTQVGGTAVELFSRDGDQASGA